MIIIKKLLKTIDVISDGHMMICTMTQKQGRDSLLLYNNTSNLEFPTTEDDAETLQQDNIYSTLLEA